MTPNILMESNEKEFEKFGYNSFCAGPDKQVLF